MNNEDSNKIWNDITAMMLKISKIRNMAEDDGKLYPKGHEMFGKAMSSLEDIRRTFQE